MPLLREKLGFGLSHLTNAGEKMFQTLSWEGGPMEEGYITQYYKVFKDTGKPENMTNIYFRADILSLYCL
jgi:hypothetical protein